MRKWTILLLVVVTATTGMIVCRASTADNPEGPPTNELIAAALAHQDNGASVDVRYSQCDQQGKVLCNFRYIRTSEALSLQEDEPNQAPDEKTSATTSFDRAKNETRSVTIPESGGGAIGSINSGLTGVISVQNVLDGSRYSVGGASTGGIIPLHEAIAKYGRLIGQEEVDGYKCWKVYIPLPNPTHSVVAYLDPAIGFNPRVIKGRVIQGIKNEVPEATFSDYREIAPGVWFPHKKVISGYVFTVTSLSTDRHPAKDDVVVRFPSRTRVRVDFKTTIITP